MTHRLAAVAALLLGLLFGPAWGQIPGLSTGASATEQAPAVVSTPPDPGQLPANWWHYFDVEGDALKQHVDTALSRIDTVLASLMGAAVEEGSDYAGRIRANLKALPAARSQQDVEKPPTAALHARYTPEELLQAASAERQARAELQREQAERDRVARALKVAAKLLDDQLAAYLKMSADDPARITRGLEIMAGRSALAVEREHLRVLNTSVTAREARAAALAREVETAGKRLVATPEALRHNASRLEQARQAVEESRQRLVKAMGKAVGAVGDTPQARAESRLRRQQVVRAAVEELSGRVAVAILEAESDLMELLSTDGVPAGLRGRLTEWGRLATEADSQSKDWAERSADERDQASELLASLSQSPEAPERRRMEQLAQSRLKLAQETLVAVSRQEAASEDLVLLSQLLERRLLSHEGYLRNWLEWTWQGIHSITLGALNTLNHTLFKIGDTPVTSLGLLRVLLILFVAWWISHLFRRGLSRIGERREGANAAAVYTLGRLAHYVIIIIGLMVALASIGIDFTNFALVAGALSVGIGFGLQSIVNNFVSGLILLFERTLKVGDFIELDSGVTGMVREINVRSTLINTNDNVDIVVPNSELVSSRVTNWTLREAKRRVHVAFGVAYGSEKELVRKAVLEAADAVPYTIKHQRASEPQVWLVSFGESSLDFELVVWIKAEGVKRPAAVQAAYLWEIEGALARHGIEIPFPQRDLHLRSALGLREHEALRTLAERSARESNGR